MKRKYLLIALIIISYNSFAQGSNGLVAHWNFNGTANDVSGHNLNGTGSNVISAMGYNGLANTAYQFNGTNSHVDVAYNTLLNLDTFSMCILVKTTGFYAGTCQENSIIARGSESSSDFFRMGYTDNDYDNDCNIISLSHEPFYGEFHSSSGPSHSQWYSDSDTVALNAWYCVVATFKNDSLKLYIDGILRKTLYNPNNYSPGTDALGIGYFPAGGSGFPYWFNGLIDDIRLYNRPLSATEVLQYCDTAKMLPLDVQTFPATSPDIIIYPNPAHNNIYIQLPGNNGKNEIQLINTLGQVITNIKPDADIVNLDMSVLPTGSYFIKVSGSGQTIVRKVLKE